MFIGFDLVEMGVVSELVKEGVVTDFKSQSVYQIVTKMKQEITGYC